MKELSLISSNRRFSVPKPQLALWLGMALSIALVSGPARGANITFRGTIAADDAVKLFDVTVATAGSVDLRSYGYAGGTTSTGTVVPPGGFDTVLTLFSASGAFLTENDDGAGAATDPSTGLAGDARITTALIRGSYILALTEYDNFSIGNLPDGFTEAGHPNFTADPSFTTGGPCPGNMFRDISGTAGRCRNGNWTVDFLNVASVAPAAPVPEPSSLLLAGAGLALLLMVRGRRRKVATMLSVGFAVALGGGSAVQAQSNQNPDFTNVSDILNGNRNLLNVTDLELVYSNNTYQGTITIHTSDSGQTAVANSSLPSSDKTKNANLYSAWMFNQPTPVTLTPLYNANGTGALTFWLQGIDSVPSTVAPWTPLAAGDEPDLNCGAVADFTQDGYDDVAFGFADGRILVASPNDVNDATKGFRQSLRTLYPLVDMVAGDFNGDGRQEIAALNVQANGGLALVIEAVDPETLVVTPVETLILTTPGTSASNPISRASIARGRFDTASHDQLVVAFTTAAGPQYVEVVDFDAGTLNAHEASALSPGNVAFPWGIIQVKTGKFGLSKNSYDQIVYASSSPSAGGRFFEVLSVDLIELTLTAHSKIDYGEYPYLAKIAVGNFDHRQPDASNPGKTQPNPNDQIAFLYEDTRDANPDNWQYYTNIYSVDPDKLNVNNPPESNFKVALDGVTPLSGTSIDQVALVATDLQGRSMVLGEPTKVTVDYTNPTIIDAMPPMHVDYITPVGGSKPEVVNISFIPDGFNSSFSLSQESKTGASTTHTTSWSAGIDVSVGGSYQVGDPDEGTGSRYSEAFHFANDLTSKTDNLDLNYSSSKFDVTTVTKKGDVVFYDDSRLNIWVYPVLGHKACPAALPNCSADQQKPLTIQFSAPDQIDTEETSTEDAGAYWYQPPWEFANVLSYPATKDQLALIYPHLANTQLSTDLSFKPTQSSVKIETTWSGGSEQGSTTSTADTLSFDNTLSYTTRWGVSKVATGKFSASLKLSGSVGFATLQTNNSQIDSSNGIGITATADFPDTSNYGYKVTPYILGSYPPSGVGDSKQPPQANIQTFGPLKTAFTADPMDSQQGGAWWSQRSAYRSAPDVALNHPNRWVVSYPTVPSDPYPSNCANTGNNASQVDCVDIAPYYDDSHQPIKLWTNDFYSMRGFFITGADQPGAGPQLGFATAGDQLDLAVRVYNYSLLAMPAGTAVHVRFYAMPWDQVNGEQKGPSILIGESKADAIPPFDDTKTDLNWRLIHAPVPFDTTAYGGQFFTFWVVVWMEDGNGNLVKEIEGHGLTSIPGSLTQPSDVPLEMALNTRGQAASYSNNVGFYHYAFPVLARETGLGAPPPVNPADITLKAVTAAKSRVRSGDLDEITAVLRAESDAASNLRIYFYDGDPAADGRLIATEIAWFEPRSNTKVRVPYHAPAEGVHRIWAVINKGRSYQMERHTAAILVGNAVADNSNSDGDQPTDEKAGNSNEKN